MIDFIIELLTTKDIKEMKMIAKMRVEKIKVMSTVLVNGLKLEL